MTKQKFDKPRRLIKPEDGTIAYTWEGKLHNWDGPALIPEGNNRKREYYIHGIQYNEEKWNELKSDRQGLPWFKNPTYKERS